MDFHETNFIDIWLFQNRIPAIVASLAHLTLTPVSTRSNASESSLEYLLECFLPSTFARIINVLPGKIQTFHRLKLEGLQRPSPVRL